jgi:hypothetical protein
MTSSIQIYQSKDSHVQLDVRIEHETIWLTQQQIGILFGVQKSAISKHLKNIFNSGELQFDSVVSVLETTAKDGKKYATHFYNLDAILSIGYRVNSLSATHFRIWANQVLKDYILRGAAIHQRLEQVEYRLAYSEYEIQEMNKKFEHFVQSSLPPKQGIFFNGQIFDAYQFVSDLIRSAKKTILLIDNYLDDSVLLQLVKRNANVAATVCIRKITASMQLDIDRYNTQYEPIRVLEIPNIHDRFLLIDEEKLYTFGASFKDLGKKIFCISLIESHEVINSIRKICEDAIEVHS